MVLTISIYFIIFFLPSLAVFIYKAIEWKKKSNRSSFYSFIASEYKSVIFVIIIVIPTLFISSKAFRKEEFKNNKELIEYYKKTKNYQKLEKIYTDLVLLDSLNISNNYNRIYYHYKITKSLQNSKNYNDFDMNSFYKNFESNTNIKSNEIYNLYLFISNYFNDKVKAKEIYFEKNLSKIKYTNYYMSLLIKNDFEKSKHYLLKEIENNGLVKTSYIQLANLSITNKKYNVAYKIISNKNTENYIPLYLKANIEFLNGHYLKSLITEYYRSYKETTKIGFVAAFLIMLIWFVFLYRMDIYEKEKISLLVFIFVFGALLANVSLLVYDYFHFYLNFYLTGNKINDLLFAIFGIGFIEETIKLIPFLFIYLFLRKQLNEPYDYLLFIMISALGFSFVENMMYFDKGVIHTISVRAVVSSIAHLFFSATLVYGIILYKYKYKKLAWFFVPLYYILAILSHGFFDYFLFFNYEIIFAFYFLIITKIFLTYINNALNNSSFFDYHIKLNTKKTRQFLAVGLSVIFALEHFYSSWYYNRNSLYNQSDIFLLPSIFVLIFLADNFSHFDLVKGKWKIFDLTLNSKKLYSSEGNYINYRILFLAHSNGKTIKKLFSENKRGLIIDRISIIYSSLWTKKDTIIENDWYVVQLEEPIKFENKTITKLVINFESKAVTLFLNNEKAYLMLINNEDELKLDNYRTNFRLLGRIDILKVIRA